MDILENVITIVCAVLASSGFWAWLQKKSLSKDARTKMLVGLGHDRIVHLGGVYLERGYITRDEYENLNDYLYLPYKEMGGNGTAEKVIQDVRKLPLKEVH